MRIESARLILRPFHDGDAAPLAAIHGDAETMRFFPRPMNRQQSDLFVEQACQKLAANGFHFLAVECKASKEFIGILGLGRFDQDVSAAMPGRPEVEIGWRLRRDVWGQGLAPEGARACLDYGWSQLNLPEIVAITYRGNWPSRRVMEKIGMARDLGGDFLHPLLPADHPLAPHVLYRAPKPIPA